MVKDDHFPIQRIQGPDPEITVFPKVLNAHRPAIASRQKGLNGGILENNILLTRGVRTPRDNKEGQE